MRIPVGVWIFSVALGGCGTSDPGKDVTHVASDTDILKGASEAVNQVVREAGDCDAMKPGLEPARQSLDEAASQIHTVTGQATLDALRKRLEGLAEVCP